MVFDWFFGKKANFVRWRAELNKAVFLDRVLDNLLLNKSGHESSVKRRVYASLASLKKEFAEFVSRLNSQQNELNEYIASSVGEIDYLSLIRPIVAKIVKILQIIDEDFHKDDYFTFIEETIKIRDELRKLIGDLEQNMIDFNDQSRKSLAWNYEGGSNNINLNDFKAKVRDLGGVINP